MRVVARRDEGEAAIVAALRAEGAWVRRLDAKDLPDLLVLFRGRIYLLEVKQPAGPRGGLKDRTLSEGQLAFLEAAVRHGVETVKVVRCVLDALTVIGVRPRKDHPAIEESK